ncbi:hypothetical protein CVT26_006652 [Gymnopilus dilepis]|uniref:Uncharacterized protein n=1 Tax=Gymnopilus dilepis TaxID=231916 RepID=A0A409Y2N5_9AGAR|nr:hypothetical protein CVT26_006652 [Gymnopilus dilepis]
MEYWDWDAMADALRSNVRLDESHSQLRPSQHISETVRQSRLYGSSLGPTSSAQQSDSQQRHVLDDEIPGLKARRLRQVILPTRILLQLVMQAGTAITMGWFQEMMFLVEEGMDADGTMSHHPHHSNLRIFAQRIHDYDPCPSSPALPFHPHEDLTKSLHLPPSLPDITINSEVAHSIGRVTGRASPSCFATSLNAPGYLLAFTFGVSKLPSDALEGAGHLFNDVFLPHTNIKFALDEFLALEPSGRSWRARTRQAGYALAPCTAARLRQLNGQGPQPRPFAFPESLCQLIVLSASPAFVWFIDGKTMRVGVGLLSDLYEPSGVIEHILGRVVTQIFQQNNDVDDYESLSVNVLWGELAVIWTLEVAVYSLGGDWLKYLKRSMAVIGRPGRLEVARHLSLIDVLPLRTSMLPYTSRSRRKARPDHSKHRRHSDQLLLSIKLVWDIVKTCTSSFPNSRCIFAREKVTATLPQPRCRCVCVGSRPAIPPIFDLK